MTLAVSLFTLSYKHQPHTGKYQKWYYNLIFQWDFHWNNAYAKINLPKASESLLGITKLASI